MHISIWVDPICPWCWITARWVVDDISQRRELSIEWMPISLLFKNVPEPGSKAHQRYSLTHGMLRVMESVRTDAGNEGVFRAYWVFGSRIHHDQQLEFDVGEALVLVGLDPAHVQAFEDESWDREIRKRMDAGLELVGEDVGTPIIAIEGRDGQPIGIFGPVITRIPPAEDSLQLWDVMITAMSFPDFWELKRTRTVPPDFGDPPRLPSPGALIGGRVQTP